MHGVLVISQVLGDSVRSFLQHLKLIFIVSVVFGLGSVGIGWAAGYIAQYGFICAFIGMVVRFLMPLWITFMLAFVALRIVDQYYVTFYSYFSYPIRTLIYFVVQYFVNVAIGYFNSFVVLFEDLALLSPDTIVPYADNQYMTWFNGLITIDGQRYIGFAVDLPRSLMDFFSYYGLLHIFTGNFPIAAWAAVAVVLVFLVKTFFAVFCIADHYENPFFALKMSFEMTSGLYTTFLLCLLTIVLSLPMAGLIFFMHVILDRADYLAQSGLVALCALRCIQTLYWSFVMIVYAHVYRDFAN